MPDIKQISVNLKRGNIIQVIETSIFSFELGKIYIQPKKKVVKLR